MKKTISLFGGLFATLFLVSAANAQPACYIFDQDCVDTAATPRVIATDLVLIVSSGGEGMTLRPEATELARDLILTIRMRQPFIRYVEGPWEDNRATNPDIVLHWGARENACRVESLGGRRYVAFYARGTNAEVETRVLRYLVPCVRRHYLRRR